MVRKGTKVKMTITISRATRDALDEFIDDFEDYISRSEVIDYILESVLEDEDVLDDIFPEVDEEEE
jgi:metal-responsive CopG/Arc/MetJ family transcriptional regulator